MPIARQAAAIRFQYPGFKVVHADSQKLKAVGELQPTSRSVLYTVILKYRLGNMPEITVLKPELVKNWLGEPIPHIYPNNNLCLHRPKYGEFKYCDLISDKIIPWTSLWLYHYENWHVTGTWSGGGEHPGKNQSK